MSKASINAAKFSQLCFDAGLTENPTTLKTTLSRVINGDSNIRMNSLETICSGIRLLPNFGDFEFSHLFDPNFDQPYVTVDSERMDSLIKDFLMQMDELQWIELRQEPALISGAIKLIAKNHGIELSKKDHSQQQAANS